MSLKLKNIVHTIIAEDLLVEARGPLAAFEYFIKAAGKTLVGANEALLFALKKVNPEIKQIYRASDEEIGKALLRKEFKEYRTIISKGLYQRFKEDIDEILKKYDLTDIEKQVAAAEEIVQKTNIRKEIAVDIVKSNFGYRKAFIKGFKTTQAPFLFLKGIGRQIPIPYLRAYMRSKIHQLSPEEMRRVYLWFFTGVGDANSIYKILKNHGIPKALTNLTGQVFSKWVFWTTAFSLANYLIDVSQDLDEEVYTSDIDAIMSRATKDFEPASIKWLFPIVVVYDQLFAPINRGGILKVKKEQWRKKLEELRHKAKNETNKIEAKIDTTKQKVVAKVDSVKNKVDSTLNNNKITPITGTAGSYESFKQFCASQNPPLTPDADDGNIGVYTAKGVEYEWDGTTFKKSE